VNDQCGADSVALGHLCFDGQSLAQLGNVVEALYILTHRIEAPPSRSAWIEEFPVNTCRTHRTAVHSIQTFIDAVQAGFDMCQPQADV
jgi:hypothetical protein